MLTWTSTFGAAALAVAIASTTATPAMADWRLDPRLCPDLVEDRYDRRVAYSRRDVREDYRDARIVNCPARAWVWTGPTYGARFHPARPVVNAIRISRGAYYYAPHRNAALVRVNLVIR